jgi:hypothetical protein
LVRMAVKAKHDVLCQSWWEEFARSRRFSVAPATEFVEDSPRANFEIKLRMVDG